MEFTEIQRQETEEFTEYLELIKKKLIKEKTIEMKRSEDLRTTNTKKQNGIDGYLEKKQLAELQLFELKISIDQQENSIGVSKNKQEMLYVRQTLFSPQSFIQQSIDCQGPAQGERVDHQYEGAKDPVVQVQEPALVELSIGV